MESSKPSSGKSSVQHPSILNPVTAKSNLTFHLFPQLPKEIREMVWTQSLTCERYITVELWAASPRAGVFDLQKTLPRDPPIDKQYISMLVSSPRPSALFGTSAESRASACRFYRVHLPCYVSRGSQSPASATFWFNPELDTLEIHGLRNFMNFANDFWRQDCRKAGLRNVCFDAKNWISFADFYQLAASTDQLRQAVSRLKHVTFIWYTDIHRVDSYLRAPSHPFPPNDPRSLPVAGATGSFSRQPDPCPIDDLLLNNAFRPVFRHLEGHAKDWMNGFQRLRAKRACVFRVAYTTGTRRTPFIIDGADAMEYLKDEEEKWRDMWGVSKRSLPRESEFLNGVSEQLDNQLQTAFGFWTVSLEPQDRVASDYSHQPAFPKNYKPELCLFHL
ncbi:uncharacterized protein FFB20_01378 [Fusarium fujikuroi]|uniref:Uncharacterized protein n=1 Tax=Fusarium fujikuroi TaxID=5127 RepID=A0A5Q3DNA3_FUSFU|nr:hypothetical protein CEK27_012216 [Fusarium fujikuroi]QGI85459.1 hypothetical protein CEK25_012188 [Fusarium fujikuroi]QGI99135.1 hypothetical protein CEK26_012204 [Fusarium fujikuroi]SCN65161.1 uncharacterized protein FFB20_01378 [Fusarium fujikuroi]SCO39879.1 uncharacterized protein FFNC_07162 [Fusarium fujikuroi]